MKLSRIPAFLLLTLACICAASVRARVLDNFDDNLKTDWTDFTFVSGFGLPKEENGQFRFELPAAGQSIFTASQKTSELLTLQEGRTIELRVDVAQAGAKDSFAILAFIPNTGGNSPGTLGGYGLAKSTTDVLLTKGINKYFVADAGAAAQLKNENITLVLSLTAKGGSVIIHGQVLDKDNNNAVIWDKTVTDTAAADVLAAGKDDPAAPYLTTGYFTLYCYEDFDANAPENPYKVYYDNAEIFVTDTTVLDDFNDNTKTDWQDFTFVNGFGLPKEQNGQFQFELPAAGQSIFTASQKTSRLFELKEGERLQFQVDVAQAGAKDSFAVLAFIPNTGGNSPATLGGYGLSKSTTDILLTKGINKYFIADAGPAAELKNENITLVLTMTARNGSLTINGKVLDKDNNNAVIWEKTVLDTPAADVLATGKDDPAAPYLTTGYFTLYCYEDFDANAPENPYRVYYDNAVVSAPPAAANVAPLISEVQPAEFSNFVDPASGVSFKVSDDKPLSPDKISLTLNGTKITAANGLTITTAGTSATARFAALLPSVNYAASIDVADADGAAATQTLYFDTFDSKNLTVEIEDYNFASGQFFDNPIPIAEGAGPQDKSYSLQAGSAGVDFNDTRTSPNGQDTLYRPEDAIRMQHTLDNIRSKYTAAGGANAGVYDYEVGDIEAGEWMNYTRTFPAGTYEVYLREAVVNMNSGESVLELVTGDRTQANPATKVLGSFLGVKSGFRYRNFLLTDGTGQNPIILRLSGVTTLRLRQVTADSSDGGRYQNYLIFIPVPDPGLQRAAVSSISPAPGSTVDTVTPAISVEIQNRDTAVNAATIQLQLNGKTVQSQVTTTAQGALVAYKLETLPPSGTTNTAQITFKDSEGVDVTAQWNFVVSYKSLDPASRVAGPGLDRGFNTRFVQAPAGSNLPNSYERAEQQLASNSTIEKFYETNAVLQVMNFSQNGPGSADGYFGEDDAIPGLDADANGNDDIAMEAFTFLDLPAGTYRFGVRSDDGYWIASAKQPITPQALPLGAHASGTADETFDVVVPASGIYPFRLVWFERGGGAYFEWFTVNPTTGERTLINAPNVTGAIKAYSKVAAAPSIQLLGASSVIGSYDIESTAVVSGDTITLPVPQGATRFFRLRSDSALKITSVRADKGNLVIKFSSTP